ncbi:TerC family protein [Geomonas terrae]|uniref:TerC family protein n=1 Tax=Geomonas terrae TaxID=2562681 RepID=A0A4S1CCP3_9BACT|nr:TerC family protein [Geomonas terrae]TGU71149.1 TerC family protein [Geomonas terrae]
MTNNEMMWIAFAVIMTVMFVLDLFVFNRKSHEIKFREALTWTVVWIGLAMLFNAGVWYVLGSAKALEFFTGYVIEESLSVDNLFVFIMIFSYFKVPRALQPKILKWGIIGALVMRGIFIMVGIGLIERFHWMVYVFGVVLIYTGFKMAFGGDEEVHPENNPMVRLVRRFVPITKRARGDRFFMKRRGIWAATPLFLTLVVVESSDVIFAVDSIPAVLAVTHDPFIVYSSNIFAIMGLRSLYYLLAHVMEMFTHLKLGVSVILAFVGAKMLLSNVVEIPLVLSLGVIIGALTISILTSVLLTKKQHR